MGLSIGAFALCQVVMLSFPVPFGASRFGVIGPCVFWLLGDVFSGAPCSEDYTTVDGLVHCVLAGLGAIVSVDAMWELLVASGVVI